MKIDVFNHFTPKAVYERFKSIAPDNPGLKAFGALPALWDLDARLKLMEGFRRLPADSLARQSADRASGNARSVAAACSVCQ